MARRRMFRRRSSGRSRRKIFWGESNLGGVFAALSNTEVATGWAAFPAGQYDFSFTPPAFQPEDLTLIRTLAWPSFAVQPTNPSGAGTSYSFWFGVLSWDAQDGNVYQNAVISHTGVGSVPDPASNTSADWLLKYGGSFTATQFTGQQGGISDTGIDHIESRAQRKLSHDTGILIIAGWNYDDPAIQDNGDTITAVFNIKLRQAFKLP